MPAGGPKFLFDEDPAPPSGEGGGLGGNSQFASVFKVSGWDLQIVLSLAALRSTPAENAPLSFVMSELYQQPHIMTTSGLPAML